MYFERYEFLQLFDEERIINPEIEWAEYTVLLKNNLIFKIFVMPYDDCCHISLSDNSQSLPFLNIKLISLKKISVRENSLYFFKETYRDKSLEESTQEPFLVVRIKPHFYFDYTI